MTVHYNDFNDACNWTTFIRLYTDNICVNDSFPCKSRSVFPVFGGVGLLTAWVRDVNKQAADTMMQRPAPGLE